MPSQQAPPPMVSSPEREGFNDFAPDPSFEANDVKMVGSINCLFPKTSQDLNFFSLIFLFTN